MATKTVQFEIKRQASPDAPAVWESFELEWRPGMNVTTAMMDIAANPVTGERQSHHARHLRLQLPGGDLRLLRHAHQRQGAHGLFGAGGLIWISPSASSRSASFRWCAICKWTGRSCLKILRRSRHGFPSTGLMI